MMDNLNFLRSRAAMAIYYVNTHEKQEEITSAILKHVKHDDPRELTRKECRNILQIAAQYGYVDPTVVIA